MGTSGVRRSSVGQVVCSAVAVGLLVASYFVPFWGMKLTAPQYPNGLHMVAYGYEVAGDLREINLINHYVGMGAIDPVPAPEMALFPWVVGLLCVLSILALLHRRLAQLAVLATAVTPLAILADLQWWLHRFGTDLNDSAPYNIEPFTPLAIGPSSIHNFRSTGMVSWGFFCMIGAAVALYIGLRLGRRRTAAVAAADDSVGEPAGGASAVASSLVVLVCVLLLPAGARSAGPVRESAGAVAISRTRSFGATEASSGAAATLTLQARIDRAPRGSTVVVEGGLYPGPLVIEGPLTVVGLDRPVIDGGGEGSVVTVSGQGVVFRGFAVRKSGRDVTEEAAGVKVRGSGHLIEDLDVRDVYFGVHLSDGGSNEVRGNRIFPGKARGARPGHAVSLWHQRGTRVIDNVIAQARDGIYMTFADDVYAEGNVVTESRYGVHSMYSENSRFVHNTIERNLLGAALMYSAGLQMRCNRIAEHRGGATAYGVLLKDIDDLVLEDNLIVANRIGIYAESAPLGPGREAIVRHNVILGHEAALALHSNVGLTFYGNQVANNLTDVRSEGAGLSTENRWHVEGRGNYWGQYQGYDRDGDGIGDIPYRYEVVMDELLRRNTLARAFVYTPANLALESAARLFPVYRPDPLLVDEYPLMDARSDACWERSP